MSFKEDPNTIYHYDDQGELHNDDGPAIITPQGYKAWYKHGDRHRVDGPAVIDPHDGSKEWWFEGNLHRTDGPAVEYDDGYKEWWINGVEQPSPDTPRLTPEQQQALDKKYKPLLEDYQIGMEE